MSDEHDVLIEPFEKEPDEFNRFISATRRAIAETSGFFIDGVIDDRGKRIRFNVWIIDDTGSTLTWGTMKCELIRAFTHAELVHHIKDILAETLEGVLNPPQTSACYPPLEIACENCR